MNCCHVLCDHILFEEMPRIRKVEFDSYMLPMLCECMLFEEMPRLWKVEFDNCMVALCWT